MKRLLLLGLLAGWSVLFSLPALAQTPAELPTEADAPDSLRLVKGFALAHITQPDGQTHRVWVPAGRPGFQGTLPFYRREEQVRPAGIGQPVEISLDKVAHMRLYGSYYEHMVLEGKRQRVLAVRVAHGPVELFNYTDVTSFAALAAAPLGGLVGVALASDLAELASDGKPAGIAARRWYVRRAGGALTRVRRDDFTVQMSAYFKDDPATATAVINHQLRYADMLKIVQGYNQNKAALAETK